MSDTSTIDKKKQKNQGATGDFSTFFLTIFTRLIVIGILVVIGALYLYSGKVAQANVLPTCMSHFPYTADIPNIDPCQIDINVVKTDTSTWSTKIEFPQDENFKVIGNTLEFLRNWANGPNSNVYKLYISNTLQQVLSCNFTIVNNVNNFANSMLTETWYLLLAPYILFFTSILTSTINFFYMLLLWFYNIYLLFSEKSVSDNKTTWKDGEMWSVFNWTWSLLYIFIFFMLFLTVGMGIVIPITAFLISMFCVIFPLFMKAKNVATGKPYGLGETIKNVFKYKLNVIMAIISIYVILTASSNFGGYAAFVALVACIILYFFSTIYQQYIPKAVDHSTHGLGNYVQAVKVCNPLDQAKHTPSMFDKIGKLF